MPDRIVRRGGRLRVAPTVPAAPLAGVPVARLDTEALVALAGRWLDGDQPRRLVQLDAWLLTLAVHSDAVHQCLRHADLVCAGSRSLVWLSRLLGEPLPQRVDPLALLLGLAEEARERERSLFLLTHEKGLAEVAAAELRERVPGVAVAGCAHASLELSDVAGWQAAASRVADSGADVVLVLQEGPQQDLFVERHLATMGCRLALGVGDAIDLLVGRVRRTPRWLARWGVETVTRPPSRRPRANRYVASCWTRLALRAALARAASQRPL